MPGSGSGAAKAKSGDNSSNASLKEAAETMAPKKAMPGSASGATKAKRLMDIAAVAIAYTCQRLTRLPLSMFTMNGLHGDLTSQVRRNGMCFSVLEALGTVSPRT